MGAPLDLERAAAARHRAGDRPTVTSRRRPDAVTEPDRAAAAAAADAHPVSDPGDDRPDLT